MPKKKKFKTKKGSKDTDGVTCVSQHWSQLKTKKKKMNLTIKSYHVNNNLKK